MILKKLQKQMLQEKKERICKRIQRKMKKMEMIFSMKIRRQRRLISCLIKGERKSKERDMPQ